METKTKKPATSKAVKAVVKPSIKKEVNKKADQATIKAVADKVRPTTVKDKNFLYRFQLEGKMEHKEEKRKRNKIRRNLKLIVNKIILDKKKDKELIKEFNIFYKNNFILNDYSLKSLTNVSDQDVIEDYTKVLNIVKATI